MTAVRIPPVLRAQAAAPEAGRGHRRAPWARCSTALVEQYPALREQLLTRRRGAQSLRERVRQRPRRALRAGAGHAGGRDRHRRPAAGDGRRPMTVARRRRHGARRGRAAAAARPRGLRAARRPVPVDRRRHRAHAAGRDPAHVPQPQRPPLRQAGVPEPDRLGQGPRRARRSSRTSRRPAVCGRTRSSSSRPAATPASRWP